MAERKRKRQTKKVGTTTLVTTGSTIRIEQPKSRRQPKPKVAVVVAQEINPVSGFTDFLREHAIVGLSIGFIMGSQMATVVKVLVTNFIDPLSRLFLGTALSQRTFTLRFHDRVANFGWGGVVSALIDLILLLIFIYLAFKFFNLDKLDKPQDPAR
ncbi:MAG TPA: MscL family protein [Verrucomicrobiae bacterium]|nr:MscL family protein [Verrucomicrobiae bacterium]